jgi:hypothetical protein
MTVRRPLALALALAALLAGPAPGRAEWAAPAGPDSPIVPLIATAVEALPAEGMLGVEFERWTVAPGPDEFTDTIVHAPTLIAVERGRLGLRLDGPADLLPAGVPATATPEALAAGADPELSAGDRLVTAPGTTVTFANAGEEPLVFVRAAVLAEAVDDVPSLPRRIPASFALERTFARGGDLLPEGPVTIALARIALAPGDRAPLAAATGPTWLYVAVGTLGERKAGATREFTYRPEATVPLAPGVATTLRNAGAEELVLLAVSVTPTGPADGAS